MIGQTPIKAEHINELRACLDAILANWPGTTDPPPPPPTGRPDWFDEQYWKELVFKQLDDPGPLEGRRSNVHRLEQVRTAGFHIRTSVAQGPPLPTHIVSLWRQAIPSLMRQFVGT